MNTYNLLKSNAKELDIICPDEEFKFSFNAYNSYSDPNFRSYFLAEFKNIKKDEIKKYLVNDGKFNHLFIMSSEYILKIETTERVVILDKDIKFLFDYNIHRPIYKLHSDKTNDLKSFNSNFFSYGQAIGSLYKFNFRFSQDFQLSQDESSKSNSTFNFIQSGRNELKSIFFDDNKTIVSFKSSFYNKIHFDKDMNITKIQFPHVTKSKLHFKSDLIGPHDYKSMIKSFEENFELYKLEKDKPYKLDTNENLFYKQITLTKEIIKNKKEIQDLENSFFRIRVKPQQYFPEIGAKESKSEATKYLNKICPDKDVFDLIDKDITINPFSRKNMVELVTMIVLMKKHNIVPIDIDTIKTLESLTLKAKELSQSFNMLKKTNQEFRKMKLS